MSKITHYYGGEAVRKEVVSESEAESEPLPNVVEMESGLSEASEGNCEDSIDNVRLIT